MTSRRFEWTGRAFVSGLVLFVLAGLLLPGCGGRPADEEAEAEATAGAIDPLTVIPQAVDAVVKVDIRKMMAVESFKKNAGETKSNDLKRLKDMGFDIEKDLDDIAVGIAFTGEEPVAYFALAGRFDLEKLEKGAKEAAKKEGVTLEDAKPHKGVKILFSEKPDPIAVALFSDKNVMLSNTLEGVKKMIDLAQGGADCVLKNAPLAAATSNFGCKKPVWATMILTEKVKMELAKNPMTLPILQADALMLTIDMPEGGIDLSFTADCSSEDGASGIATMLNAMKGMIAGSLKGPDGKPTPEAVELMSAIKVETKGKQTIVQVAITAEQIEKLESKAPESKSVTETKKLKKTAP